MRAFIREREGEERERKRGRGMRAREREGTRFCKSIPIIMGNNRFVGRDYIRHIISCNHIQDRTVQLLSS